MMLDSHLYGDPSEVVERKQLDELGCTACKKAGVTMYGMICAEPKNERQKGVPSIGHRCKWFDLFE